MVGFAWICSFPLILSNVMVLGFFSSYTTFFIRDGVARIITIVYKLDSLNHANLCDWVLPTTLNPRGEKPVGGDLTRASERFNPLLHGLSGKSNVLGDFAADFFSLSPTYLSPQNHLVQNFSPMPGVQV